MTDHSAMLKFSMKIFFGECLTIYSTNANVNRVRLLIFSNEYPKRFELVRNLF